MDKNNYKDIIINILKQDLRIWNEDKTELNQTLLFDLLDKTDETIIDLLLQNKETREKFFAKIKDVYVFKINDFKFFMEENKINNSYTQYRNRIGLSDGKELLKNKNEVVLDFPFKDCVLEGGQSTEEGMDTYFEYDKNSGAYKQKQEKRKEIFFNQVLARDEIDRLFDEKALVNWKRYTKDGEQKVNEIKRDENGTIKENLIIKGNNLLALHSLKSQFAGKVKLIYIDPPYNTGNDTFKYNDNFNHSTWLTFMRNRLEIASDLLKDDGAIFIECDNNEIAYLKVLADEVFGISKFVNVISVKSSTPSGVKTSHADKTILKSQDFILVYKKNVIKFKPQYTIKEKWDTHYMFYIDKILDGSFVLISLVDKLIELGIFNTNNKINDFEINKKEHKEFYKKQGDFIVRKSTHDNKQIKNICKNNQNKIIIQNGNYYYNHEMLQPISKSIQTVLIGQVIATDISNVLCDFWNDIDFQNTQNQGGVSLPAGKKPEQLLYRIIDMITNKGDIVLDYHFGTGTTGAVAHKMDRQYIGIEQLSYEENDSFIRLHNVIKGEQTGISKALNWKGGGDFIYFELAKWNEKAKEEINNCKNLDELEKLFNILCEKYFLDYNLKINEFKNTVIKESEFISLSLEEQKRMFLTMLDLNQMYVQKSEMSDIRFGISEEDQKCTNSFYEEV